MRAGGADQRGVAVGRGAGRHFSADVAACARPVVDDQLLTELLGQTHGDHPGRGIGGAAGWKGDDHPQRLDRPGASGGRLGNGSGR